MNMRMKTTGLNLTEAIIALRTGHRVGRQQWEALSPKKKMIPWLMPLCFEEHSILPTHLYIQQAANADQDGQGKNDEGVQYVTKVWLPSIDDLTANDYKIVRIDRRARPREPMAAELETSQT